MKQNIDLECFATFSRSKRAGPKLQIWLAMLSDLHQREGCSLLLW
jgi:hypothetical protein